MDNTQVELAALIARGWLDDEFKELLESNPEAAFNEYNLKYEDYPSFILPAPPGGAGAGADIQVFCNLEAEGTPATCTYSMMINYEHGRVNMLSKDGVHLSSHKIDPLQDKVIVYKCGGDSVHEKAVIKRG